MSIRQAFIVLGSIVIVMLLVIVGSDIYDKSRRSDKSVAEVMIFAQEKYERQHRLHNEGLEKLLTPDPNSPSVMLAAEKAKEESDKKIKEDQEFDSMIADCRTNFDKLVKPCNEFIISHNCYGSVSDSKIETECDSKKYSSNEYSDQGSLECINGRCNTVHHCYITPEYIKCSIKGEAPNQCFFSVSLVSPRNISTTLKHCVDDKISTKPE